MTTEPPPDDRTARDGATTDGAPGPLVFVGGGEWTDGASFDRRLLARSGGEVVVLPTAAAYEHPDRAVATAERWFASLGGRVRPCMVLSRTDADDERLASVVREARFVYLSGGSPLHLRSVLKDSSVLTALRHAWHLGAVVAGSSAGAMSLSDPMVDPRGGALTVGLGFVRDMAVVPHYTGEMTAQLRRTVALAHSGCAVVALPETTALIRESDGVWSVEGRGSAAVFVDGRDVGLTALAGRPTD
ncbi:MAG: cysnophycinase-like exopeptidase [Acidimicrobiaceae bacterium]|nr:cysnophycinase-like exopeptidase [Acidimicrobiaceae bacterium]